MMAESDRRPSFLAHLTCAALALPGLLQSAAAGRIEETHNMDFQYGLYTESDQRMRVDIFEGAVSAPVGKNKTWSLNLTRDLMAGASPVHNVRNADGEVIQVISAASPTSYCGQSICDIRDAISTNLSHFFNNAVVGFGGGYSREWDYASKFFNTTGSLDFNKKLTTVNGGVSLAFDEIEPTPSGYTSPPFDARSGFRGSKTTRQYLVGVAQIIDKDSVVKSNMTFTHSSGYLTDPYKQVAIYGDVLFADFGFVAEDQETIINERRPRNRFEWAWLTQYVRHIGAMNHAAFHADYRFNTNNWGINAHTMELSWHQPVFGSWQLIPNFRYYSQDQADFYQPVFDSDVVATVANPDTFDLAYQVQGHRFFSSDYRLAGFGVLSGGIYLSNEVAALHRLRVQVGVEYFDRRADYQLGGAGRDNFSNFNYYLATASFSLKF